MIAHLQRSGSPIVNQLLDISLFVKYGYLMFTNDELSKGDTHMINEPKREEIRVVALLPPADKVLLDQMAERLGDASLTATIRWLIRQEARRLGIEPAEAVQG